MADKPEDSLEERLLAAGFRGPYSLGGADIFGSLLGGLAQGSYAICQACGSMVALNDPEEVNGKTLERSIRVHAEWHHPPVKP